MLFASRMSFGFLVVVLVLFGLQRSTSGLVIVEPLLYCQEETPYSSDGETCKSHKIENTGQGHSDLEVTINWANGNSTTVNLDLGDSHTALCKATSIDCHEKGLPLEGEVTITVVEAGTP